MKFKFGSLRDGILDKVINIAIIALVISAFVLGAKITGKKTNAPPARPTAAPESSAKSVLETPSQDASDEEKKQFAMLVSSQAQGGDTLDITGCNPSPQVLRLIQGQTLTVKNPDSVGRTLTISPEMKFEIPPGDEKEVKVDFGHGIGIYGYGCDNTPKASGVFLIVE